MSHLRCLCFFYFTVVYRYIISTRFIVITERWTQQYFSNTPHHRLPPFPQAGMLMLPPHHPPSNYPVISRYVPPRHSAYGTKSFTTLSGSPPPAYNSVRAGFHSDIHPIILFSMKFFNKRKLLRSSLSPVYFHPHDSTIHSFFALHLYNGECLNSSGEKPPGSIHDGA